MAQQARLNKVPVALNQSYDHGRLSNLTHSSQSSRVSTTFWDQSDDFSHEEVYRARFDQDALDAESSRDAYTLSAATSTRYSESIADGQPGTSRKKKRSMAEASVLSYNSERDASQFVKDFHGRGFNTLNDAYILPSDGMEWERLDKQHIALVLGMGGLTPCPDVVDAVLAPVDGEEKKILDIGCGNGIWAIEMARKYPHCSVVGVDLAPTSLDPSLFPPNITFEIDDVNNGLAHFHESFDVVHARCISGGIQRFGEMMEDAQLCLKPGGLIVFVDGDGTICSTDRLHPAKFPEDASSKEEGSWFRKVVREAWYACNIAGSGIHKAEELQDLGLWNHPLCDPDTASSGELFLPIGPWARVSDHAQSQQIQYAGALIRQAFLGIHRAYHGILMRQGMSQDVVNDWSDKVDDELNSMRTRLWVRFRFCWARRRAGDSLPAAPLASDQSLSTSNTLVNAGSRNSVNATFTLDEGRPRYPFFNVWTSAKEAAAEVKRRRDARGVFPEPDVQRAWEQKQLRQLVA